MQMRRDDAVAAGFIEVDEFEFRKVPARAKCEPSHASEAVDADACCHVVGCCVSENSAASGLAANGWQAADGRNPTEFRSKALGVFVGELEDDGIVS